MIVQKVIVPYMKDAANDTLFTMQAIDKIFTPKRDLYEVKIYLMTRLEPGSVRKIEVMADYTI